MRRKKWTMQKESQGLRKDHKGHIDCDPNKGPKLRPLAAANKAPNAALGNLAAKITKAVGDNVSQKYGNELISTEQLKRRIEETNKVIRDNWESDISNVNISNERQRNLKPPPIQKRDSLSVIGMDVVALYPSIKRDMARMAISKAIERADNRWNNVDIRKLTRYVSLTTPSDIIKRK